MNQIQNKNNIFFRLLFAQFGDLELPETVGIQMKEYIENEYEQYRVGEDYNFYFHNGKEDTAFNKNSFSSKISINESIPQSQGKIEIADHWSGINILSDNFLEIPEEYSVPKTAGSFSNPFPSLILKKMVEKQWEDFDVEFENEDIINFFKGMNNDLLNKMPKKGPIKLKFGPNMYFYVFYRIPHDF